MSIFRQAIHNILHLPNTELTYAQIVDGLPLQQVFSESHWPVPSVVAAHESLCDGALDRVRIAREQFDVRSLLFQPLVWYFAAYGVDFG